MPPRVPPRSSLFSLDAHWQLAVDYHDDLRYPLVSASHSDALPGVALNELAILPPPDDDGPLLREPRRPPDDFPGIPEHNALARAGEMASARGTPLSPVDEVVYWPRRLPGKREGFVWITASDPCPTMYDDRYPDPDHVRQAHREWCRRHPSQCPPEADIR